MITQSGDVQVAEINSQHGGVIVPRRLVMVGVLVLGLEKRSGQRSTQCLNRPSVARNWLEKTI